MDVVKLGPDEIHADQLACARTDMFTALGLFSTHARNTTSLMLTVVTALFAVTGFLLRQDTTSSSRDSKPLVAAGAVLLLAAIPILAHLSRATIRRYYALYVSSLIFAAQLHYRFSSYEHAWFKEIREFSAQQLGTEAANSLFPYTTGSDAVASTSSNPKAEDAEDELLKLRDSRVKGRDHTWFRYSQILGVIEVVSALYGVAILLWLFI